MPPPRTPLRPLSLRRYGVDGEASKEAFVIGIAGGSASGKTTGARRAPLAPPTRSPPAAAVADHIISSLAIPWVCLLSQDSFYKVRACRADSARPELNAAQVLGEEDLALAHSNNYDFDHPRALDMELLVRRPPPCPPRRSAAQPGAAGEHVASAQAGEAGGRAGVSRVNVNTG